MMKRWKVTSFTSQGCYIGLVIQQFPFHRLIFDSKLLKMFFNSKSSERIWVHCTPSLYVAVHRLMSVLYFRQGSEQLVLLELSRRFSLRRYYRNVSNHYVVKPFYTCIVCSLTLRQIIKLLSMTDI